MIMKAVYFFSRRNTKLNVSNLVVYIRYSNSTVCILSLGTFLFCHFTFHIASVLWLLHVTST